MSRVIHSLWPWQGSCLATAKPNQVGGLTATASGQTTINLSWDADTTPSPDEAAEYDIERSNDGTTGWSVIATVAATARSFSDVTLSASTTRHYRIVAKNCFDVAMPSTSASATTASSTPTAAWSLDFSTGTPSGYTLTRASSGTFVDSSGYIATASTDAARLTHERASPYSRLGLLIEQQRTNEFQYSEDFANAYWTKSGSGINNNSGAFWTSPANTATAVLLRQNTSNAAHYLSRQVTSVTNATFSIFAQKQNTTGGSGRVGKYLTLQLVAATGNYYHATFDLDAGTMTQAGTVGTTVTSGDNGIEAYRGGWYRIWVRGTRTSSGNMTAVAALATNDSNGTPTMALNGEVYTGANATDGVYVWGAAFGLSNQVPLSYMPSTGAAATTREADLVHVLDSAITSWGDPGALVVHFYPPGQAGTLISTDDAATAQVGIEASTTTAARAFWSSGSTSTGTIGTGVQKAVHYWNGSTSKFAINGSTPVSNTNNLTIANTDFVTLGAEATDSAGVPGTFSQYANCVIRKVEFYSGTLTDANLQTITT